MVLAWFRATSIALMLSICSGVGVVGRVGMIKAIMRFNQRTSWRAWMAGRYSASYVLNAIVACFLDAQDKGAPNEMWKWSVVERLYFYSE